MTAVPANVKKPTDRLAKAEANDAPFVIEHVVGEGEDAKTLTFTVDREVGNDYEVMELFADAQTNPVHLTTLLRKLLGQEQVNALKDSHRDDSGRVNPEKMFEFLGSLMEQLGNQ